MPRDKIRAALFLSSTMRDWKLGSSVAGEIPGLPSRIRLLSTTDTISIPQPTWLLGFQPHSKHYYHNTSPLWWAVYIHNDRDFMETPIPRATTWVERAALLKIHSHTFERQGYGADKVPRKKKWIKKERPSREEHKQMVSENHRHAPPATGVGSTEKRKVSINPRWFCAPVGIYT